MSSTSFLTIEETNELLNDSIDTELERIHSGLNDNDNISTTTSTNLNLDSNSKSRKSKSKSRSNSNSDNKETHEFTIKKDIFTDEELTIKPETIFIKHSKITKDELIKYNIIKHNIIPYKCSGKSCPTTKTNMWRRKPIYLILFRKNNIQKDCRPCNLQLICPNCYCLEYGAQSFEKMRKTFSKKCLSCDYPIKAEMAHTTNYCYVCTKNIERISKQYNHLHTNNDKSVKHLQSLNSSYENEVANMQLDNPELDLLSDLSMMTYNKETNENIFEKYGFDEEIYKRAMNNMIATDKQNSKKYNKPKYNYKGHNTSSSTSTNLEQSSRFKLKLNTNPHNSSTGNVDTSLDDELNNI